MITSADISATLWQHISIGIMSKSKWSASTLKTTDRWCENHSSSRYNSILLGNLASCCVDATWHTPLIQTPLWYNKYTPSWHSLMGVTPSAGQCTLTHYKMCSGTAWGTQQIAKVWGKSDPWRPNPKHTAPKGNNYKRPGAGHQRTPPVVFCQCFDRPEQRNLHNIKLLVQWCDWSVCLGLHCSCTVL